MKLTKNAVILSGAFATLLASAVVPVPDSADHPQFLAKHFSSVAWAKGDDDDDDDNSGSGSSSSDDDDDDDDDDNSGSGSSSDDDDDDDDDSDSDDDDDDDNSGSGSRNSGSDDDDDDSGRRGGILGALFGGDRRGGSSDETERPRVQLQVSGANLQGLLNGSIVAVDNLGRALEVELETEHGTTKVIAKPHGGDARRNPGDITAVRLVPASQAPAHQ